jgi:hypothetical protein
VKGGVAFEEADIGREKPKANGAAAVAVVDAVDQRREFLTPVTASGGTAGRLMPPHTRRN